jgi:hypothetical protein
VVSPWDIWCRCTKRKWVSYCAIVSLQTITVVIHLLYGLEEGPAAAIGAIERVEKRLRVEKKLRLERDVW